MTNDTVAINAAITAADALSEGELRIPAGSYLLSQRIDVPVNSPLIITGMVRRKLCFVRESIGGWNKI